MKMISALIFDFDGLIFDTETHQYNVLQQIFQEYNCQLPLSRWQEEIGTYTGFSPFKYLQDQLQSEINIQQLKDTFKKSYMKKLSQEKARDGVEDYLKKAKELKLKIGLASSSSYEWVSTYLKQLNLFDHFDCIKTKDDVEKVKPNPALYKEASKCLDVSPSNCLVFEDSVNGAIAAKRAGMTCVIVPNEVTKGMDFGTVDYRIDSMGDLALEDILTRFR